MRSSRLLPVCAVLFMLFGMGASARLRAQLPGTPAHAYTIQYELDLTHPVNHLAGVRIHVSQLGAAALDFEMPAWYPGRYSIFNYAVNVQNVHAYCGASTTARPVRILRTGPSSWRVPTLSCPEITLAYQVYGNNLSGSFSQIDGTHANINGGPVLMYLRGHKPDPVSLTVQAPSGWQVISSLGALNQTTITAPNYDVLIDAPIEAAPDFTVDRFQDAGRTYRVVIHSYAAEGRNRTALLSDLQRIVHAENSIWGPPADLSRYTFFFHFDPQAVSDGMEHLYGTQIIVPYALASPEGLRYAWEDAAHEFFHQWNVKRLRPVELGPWDYQNPDPTRSLWIAEGLTQYYGDITPERAGIESASLYLRDLADSISSFRQQAGRFNMSAADASLTAWFHDRTPFIQQTNRALNTISYYQKGELLGLLLDLRLREQSDGRTTLDDVMRAMWKRYYLGPTTTYYLQGHGYTEQGFRQVLDEVSGHSYAAFFRDYVDGTKPLPMTSVLHAAGLRLSCAVPAHAYPQWGMLLRGNVVGPVFPGGPADGGGLGRGDVIEKIGGKRVNSANIMRVLRAQPARRAVAVAVLRHEHQAQASVTPAPPAATACGIEADPAATPAQAQLRQSWLTSN